MMCVHENVCKCVLATRVYAGARITVGGGCLLLVEV